MSIRVVRRKGFWLYSYCLAFLKRVIITIFPAAVVKLVDTGDSKSPAEMCDGSSPSRGTNSFGSALHHNRVWVTTNKTIYLLPMNTRFIALIGL